MKAITLRKTIALVVLLAPLSGAADPKVPTSVFPERPANKDVKSPSTIPPVPPLRAVPLDPALQQAARDEIKAEIAATDPVVRAHAVEAAATGMKADGKAILLEALRDTEGIVRFAAAMACGDMQLTDAHDRLFAMLDDENMQVRIATRYALHRLGDKRFTHYLEQTSLSPMPGVRGNTALVLGRLEEPSAAKLLRPMLRDADWAVHMQAAEAMWRLGDEGGMQMLISSMVSGHPDDQIVAMQSLIGPRNLKVLGHVQACLESEYLQVQLVAARSIAELRPSLPYTADEGYGFALQGAASADLQLKMLAALAMGSIGRSDSQDALRVLLAQKPTDGGPNPAQQAADVRLAAAQAILQLKP